MIRIRIRIRISNHNDGCYGAMELGNYRLLWLAMDMDYYQFWLLTLPHYYEAMVLWAPLEYFGLLWVVMVVNQVFVVY